MKNLELAKSSAEVGKSAEESPEIGAEVECPVLTAVAD